MTHPNEEIARRAFEAFHKDRDNDAISQYFAEDLEYHLGATVRSAEIAREELL